MARVLQLACNGQSTFFEARRLVAAGYTGRNRAQVQAHIDELSHQGIPAPERFPTLYEIDLALLSTGARIAPTSPTVSGEAEAVLLFPTSRLEDALVSVGSDFTDRVEERVSIPRSKQQPKPIAAQVWRYREVAAAWDDIAVRSWTSPEPESPPYQSGKLGHLLSPPDLLTQLDSLLGETSTKLPGTILLMGTVPLCAGEFHYAHYFACELETPAGMKLSYSCQVNLPPAEQRRHAGGNS